MKIEIKVQNNEQDEIPQRSIIYIDLIGANIKKEIREKKDNYWTVYKHEVIPSVLEQANLPLNTKVIWSKKAGCSCGCSPGFLITGKSGFNIFVKVSSLQ